MVNFICGRNVAVCSWGLMKGPCAVVRTRNAGVFGHELLEPDIERIAPSLEWASTFSGI